VEFCPQPPVKLGGAPSSGGCSRPPGRPFPKSFDPGGRQPTPVWPLRQLGGASPPPPPPSVFGRLTLCRFASFTFPAVGPSSMQKAPRSAPLPHCWWPAPAAGDYTEETPPTYLRFCGEIPLLRRRRGRLGPSCRMLAARPSSRAPTGGRTVAGPPRPAVCGRPTHEEGGRGPPREACAPSWMKLTRIPVPVSRWRAWACPSRCPPGGWWGRPGFFCTIRSCKLIRP